jgi:ABC-type sugar transport system substrate-binding protein
MILRATVIAAAAAAALAFTAPARADGFPVGFILGSGPSDWLPRCKAPEVLTEVKDRAGKLHWICTKPQTPANVQAANAPHGVYARR